MRKFIRRLSYCCLCAAVLACPAGASCCQRAEGSQPDAGGSTVAHQVELTDPVDPSKPVRVYSVVQRRDADGLPIEYSLFISTPVCMDGKCKTVDATMVWNALGYYERLECSPDKPLTKKEHQPFDAADYTKLDRILRDRHSVLGKHSLAFMVQRATDNQTAKDQATKDQGIDAWTGPTPATVQQSVVENAAYTTWVMWRWANGEIVERLRGLTEQSCTPHFLKRLLRCEDKRKIDFALAHVIERHPDDEQYLDDVFHVLDNGDRKQVTLSLRFLSGAMKDKKKLHARLAESCCRMKPFCSSIVLDYFAADTDLPAATLDELTARLGHLPYFQVHLTLRLLEKRSYFSSKTESDVSQLLDNDDFFIARRASEYLMKQDLGSTTKSKLSAFRRRNRDRL